MTEMEAKLLASIDGVKNEINDVKTEQIKKGLTNIEQVFWHSYSYWTKHIVISSKISYKLYKKSKYTLFLKQTIMRLMQIPFLHKFLIVYQVLVTENSKQITFIVTLKMESFC